MAEEKEKKAPSPTGGAKKKLKNIAEGIAYIRATFNNTIITITDKAGNSICSASPGRHGFKGTRKGPKRGIVRAKAVVPAGRS